jgi:hypothetical protein
MKKPIPRLIWEKPFWACSACAWKDRPPKRPAGPLHMPEASPEIAGAFLEHRCARYPREPRESRKEVRLNPAQA